MRMSKLFALLITIFAGSSTALWARWQVGVGLTLLEEGDDRMRRGLWTNIEKDDRYAKLYYSYRSFGPVEEETYLLALDQSYPLPYLRRVFFHVGGALLSEKTRIYYSDLAPSSSAQRSDTRYNIGLTTGLQMRFRLSRYYNLKVAWETALFPAGLFAGLFLASGRKQFISIGLTYSL